MLTTDGATDATRRLDWLHDIAALLWPGAHDMSTGVPAAEADFWLLPNANRPRLLVPGGSRRAAAAAVRHYGEQLSFQGRVKAAGLAAGLRTGAVQRFLADGVALGRGTDNGITAHLADKLGQDVLVSLHLSAPRANRKPVLQVLSTSGETIAFVKIGVDARTSGLVRHEASALRRLSDASFQTVRTPPLLAHDVWNDLDVLVIGALPVWGKRDNDSSRGHRAMTEIAGLVPATEQTLGASEYLRRLRLRLEQCNATPAQASVVDQLTDLVTVAGEQPLTFGAWHGDFTPWNCAPVDGRLLVWDWERLTDPVPYGYDRLHHDLQSATVQRGVPLAQAAATVIDGAPAGLRAFEVAERAARTTAALYLVELGTRYLNDDQAAAGGHGGRIEDWLVPALRTAVHKL
ncbi:hypothetical protein [Kribbella sp. CA-294648]|uniref:hypothetical protein n=1 Tax=Kribbella sp. CA-294648 TaxID=3239948 RepID=UPI003D92515E